jgi:hypothetical protein
MEGIRTDYLGSGAGSKKHALSLPEGSVQPCLTEIEGKATAMNGRRGKEKVKMNGKRGQLRRYDPLDFSRFTASKNAAGGFFNRPWVYGRRGGDF